MYRDSITLPQKRIRCFFHGPRLAHFEVLQCPWNDQASCPHELEVEITPFPFKKKSLKNGFTFHPKRWRSSLRVKLLQVGHLILPFQCRNNMGRRSVSQDISTISTYRHFQHISTMEACHTPLPNPRSVVHLHWADLIYHPWAIEWYHSLGCSQKPEVWQLRMTKFWDVMIWVMSRIGYLESDIFVVIDWGPCWTCRNM